MDTQAQALNPWLSIWTKPRKTIRWIVETDPERHVLLLAALYGLAEALDQAEGDSRALTVIFILALTGGPVRGIVSLYLQGALLTWLGSSLDGQGTAKEVRAALAWSHIPSILVLLVRVPALLLFGDKLFMNTSSGINVSSPLGLLETGIEFIDMLLAFVGLVILLKCVEEIHRFSTLKAFVVVLLPTLLVMGVLFAAG